MIQRRQKNSISIFLDSGAFSAYSKGANIDLADYISFIKANIQYLETYANLDVIGDPEATLQNQRTMEAAGLNPLPCYHYGEPIKYLNAYMGAYDYIALGGMVPISSKDLAPWLDVLFTDYICDGQGLPKVKIHGFGLTSLRLMLRYPWYSVDSTSWVLTSRMGSVFVPVRRNGQWVYDENSWKVTVSSRSPAKGEQGAHIETFPSAAQEVIFSYFQEKGFKLGKSEFRLESSSYQPKDGERWFGKAREDGQREVELVLESGLCNNYKDRDRLNIIYFLDLERSMPAWPWAWKRKTAKGFL